MHSAWRSPTLEHVSAPPIAEQAPRPLPRWVEAPLRRPKVALAVLLLVAGVLGAGLLRLRFDPSTERVFPDGHWAVTTFEQFREAFGGDESVFVALEVPEGDVFTVETLTVARRFARAAAKLDGVARAFSLPDVPVIRLVPGVGPTLVRPLPEDLRQASPETLAAWRRDVLAFPYVEQFLVSRDRRAMSVVVLLERLDAGIAGAEQNVELVRALQSLARDAEQEHGLKVYLAGSPLVKAEIIDAIRTDMIRFSGPLVLIALITAWLVLRSLPGTLLTLGVLVVSIELTLGALGHLGVPLDTMTSLIPTLLLVIGVADALHLLVEQRAQAAQLGPDATGVETARRALRHVFLPCLLTSVTTALGFGSLVLSPIPPIRAFGVAAAVASLTAFAVSVVFIPAAAALLPPPHPKPGQKMRIDRLADAVLRRPRLGLAVGLAFTLVCGLGWTRVVVDTDFLSFFPASSSLRQDAQAIQERFVGIAPCELLVQGPPGTSRSPQALRAILALERDLEAAVPFVDYAFSAADCVSVARGILTGERSIPDSPEDLDKLETLLRLVAGNELPLDRLIAAPGGNHPDAEWLRVIVRAEAVGSARMNGLIDTVARLEAQHLAPLGLRALPTGTTVVFSQTADTIMSGQIESFGVAFLIITLVMAAALRSLRLGLLSMVPNMIPIVALIGAMGLLEIPFNSFNSMVASIALGIAVDDTIHILLGFQRFSRDRPLASAVHETIAHEGTAVLSTSTVLFCGFAVLLGATFAPTANFGLLTAIAIAAALVGDLVVTPALLLLLPIARGAPPAAGQPSAGAGSSSA